MTSKKFRMTSKIQNDKQESRIKNELRNAMKNISILGSTGSIGTQTLEVVRKNKDLKVTALSAGHNIDLLEKQIREFHPVIVCVWDEQKGKDLALRVKDLSVSVVTGMEGLIECATEKQADIVVTAVVGMIGILPTIEAIQAGKDVALANKETLVTAGHIITPLVEEYGVKLLPVDSEHSAIFQALQGEEENEISRIILTASGGPFRGKKRKDLEHIQVEDALKHPNWSMGRKITIDSSTMVNKGLEVMEAKWLFHVGLDKIQVVIQPQSVIHSAVEFIDGSIMAQLGTPDMKLPIQYALFYPERRVLSGERIDFFQLGKLTFEEPDYDTFTGLKLAYEVAREGGSMPTVYNAANELAVAKFLKREIKYLDIVDLIQAAVKNHKKVEKPTVGQILNIENETYDFINELTK
jgi:1-deoxy-D-xylulose-5-phosphate reductoisomerase